MEDPQTIQPLRVLVLDRSEESRSRVVATLEANADGPLAISTASEAEEFVPSPQPRFDVVVLSLGPDEVPLQRAKALRRTVPEVPIIVLGGVFQEQDARELVEVGIQAESPPATSTVTIARA